MIKIIQVKNKNKNYMKTMKLQVRIIFIILIFFSQNTFAQKVFNVQADFIYFEDNDFSFYKKEGNMYNEMQLTFRHYYHKPTKFSFRKSMIDTDELPQKRISINKIKNQKINSLIKKTSNQSYFLKDEDEIYILKLSKNALYSFNEFRPIFDDSDETQVKPLDWEFYGQTHLNYCIVNINNERPLIIILENFKSRGFLMNGYLLSFKDSYKIKYQDSKMSTFEKSGITTTTKKELLQKIPLNEIEKDTYKIINNQLTDIAFNNILIPKKLDTLYIDNGLIIGKTKKQIFVFNSELQNITPKNLKAIYPYGNHYPYDSDLYQVLIKNKIKYLTSNGNVLDQLPTVVDDFGDICGTAENIYYRKIIKKDTFYILNLKNMDESYSEITNNELILFPESAFDEVSFLNYVKEVSQDFDSEQSTFEYDFFMVKKDNKYGIYEYSINNEDQTKNKNLISLTSIVPLNYDEIEVGIPFLVKKNGLVGYYGINPLPKYKSIGIFKGAFARFVLPNNKKGWLDNNGNEYFDK